MLYRLTLSIILLLVLYSYADSAHGQGVDSSDVEITLTWIGPQDMDLWIVEPDDSILFYGSSPTSSGGTLVSDDPGCLSDELAEHQEVASWPPGTSPVASFEVYADLFSSCGIGIPNWTLTVTIGGETLLSVTENEDMGTPLSPTGSLPAIEFFNSSKQSAEPVPTLSGWALIAMSLAILFLVWTRFVESKRLSKSIDVNL